MGLELDSGFLKGNPDLFVTWRRELGFYTIVFDLAVVPSSP